METRLQLDGIEFKKFSLKDAELSHARQTFFRVRHAFLPHLGRGRGAEGGGGGAASDEALSPKNVCVGG